MAGPTIFERIIAREVPSARVYEDERVVAFLDVRPVKRGHTLVVPRAAVDRVFDLERADYDALWAAAWRIAPALVAVTGADRVSVLTLGFEVPHAHVHLVPIDGEADLDLARRGSADAAALAALAAEITGAIRP